MPELPYEITPAQFRELQSSGAEFTLIDVREDWERREVSLPNSLHIPMEEVPARQQELDPDSHIVVYCHLGVRSLSVTDWLRRQDFERVQSLSGGIDRYAREIDPTLPRYEY